METIHQIIIESVSGGFWHFVGYWIMIALIMGIPERSIIYLINRPFRHYTLKKHGYPPRHCDADGDIKDESN